MKKFAIVAAVVSLISCSGLSSLDPSNAEQDARRAVSAGDHRLLAVAGFSLEVPGTTMTARQAEALYGLREIEGTSDTWDSVAEAYQNARARDYADAYNRVVIEAVPNPPADRR